MIYDEPPLDGAAMVDCVKTMLYGFDQVSD
jgi:hypothetical protein